MTPWQTSTAGFRIIGTLAYDSYSQFLADLKGRIQAAQFRAALAVKRELVLLYWQIGCDILKRQARELGR